MSEVSTVKSRASVMLYNNEKKAWEPAEGIRGMSYVQVYHHEGNNTFRIVGRCMTDHQVVVINSAIIRNMKYNAATPTFHQWRDQRQVYGLNFHSKDDAAQFKDAIDDALDALNSVAPTPPAAPPGPPQPPPAPPAPSPPAAPPGPSVPAAPPGPPMGGGGVPAPPPPPPAPPAGGGGGSGGGSLASQIAAAKLKKASSEPKVEPKSSSSGSFGGDMMAEMQRKLAARKAKDGAEEQTPVRNQVPEVRSEPRTERIPSANKLPKSNVPAPPTSNHSPVKSSASKQDSKVDGVGSSQLQELKMEILAEFRKDLDAAKADIIQAMRQEFSRTR
ncbi:vasodilator-stimulated phosphoprotein-like isoform X2 [Dendronephthya gigantea]|uniref:vasodilator-stimulated phosphoprotein-like isoform X2 n=1 Tax=Dendronephthya gigantea TaxID=151771 RepID=UPI0010692A59|nr:vasodilator-stimulated phosphoprotein-like isoform X2 [Dendronephthya gigantea]